MRDGQTLTADDGDWTGTDPLSLRLPVAALRRRRRQLHRHRRRHERHLRARPAPTSATRCASRSPRPTSPATPPPTRSPTAAVRRRPARQHRRPDPLRHRDRGLDAHARHRHLDRHGPAGPTTSCGSAATAPAPTAWRSPARRARTYTLTADDLDATIRALVTASNAGGVAGARPRRPRSSRWTRPPTPSLPLVSGDRVDGETLTADDGTWTGTQPLLHTYQWQRCDALGANCADHRRRDQHRPTTLTGDDVGHGRAHRGHRRQRRRRPPPPPRAPAARSRPRRPSTSPSPTTTGTTAAGEILTAHDGTWTGSRADDRRLPVGALRHRRRQLRRHRRRHRPAPTRSTDDDAGHTVRVAVTYTNAAGTDAARSAPTAVVDGNPPANTVAPLALRHRPRRRDADARRRRLDRHADRHLHVPVAALRRGRRDCADIAGATGLTYDLQAPTSAARSAPSSPPRTPTATTRPPPPVSAVVAAAPPGRHDRPRRRRHRHRRRDRHRRSRHLVRHRARHLRLPVAALRPRRHRLRRDPRRHRRRVHAHERRRRPRHPRRGHRHERRRLRDRASRRSPPSTPPRRRTRRSRPSPAPTSTATR